MYCMCTCSESKRECWVAHAGPKKNHSRLRLRTTRPRHGYIHFPLRFACCQGAACSCPGGLPLLARQAWAKCNERERERESAYNEMRWAATSLMCVMMNYELLIQLNRTDLKPNATATKPRRRRLAPPSAASLPTVRDMPPTWHDQAVPERLHRARSKGGIPPPPNAKPHALLVVVVVAAKTQHASSSGT